MKTETKEQRDVDLHEAPPVDGQLVHVDTSTGQEMRVPSRTGMLNETPLSLRDETFNKIAALPVTPDEDDILRREVDEDREVDILPTGEVYMSHVFVRRRLNAAFRPMGWGLRPLSAIAIDPQTNVMYREYALMVKGVIVATAFGSTKYQQANERMDYADAAEAVRSNALTRCSKDLGIGSECWDSRFCERWKNKHAVHVWTGYKTGKGEFKVRDHWRRVDMNPARGEFALVEGTPNAKHKDIKNLKYDTAASWAEAKDLLHAWISGKRGAVDEKPEPPTAGGGGESSRSRNAKPKGEKQEQAATEVKEDDFLKDGITIAGKVDPRSPDAKRLIMQCKILKRGTNKDGAWTLHLIKMHSGTEYTTFSSTVYARAQKCWAARVLVDIYYDEVDVNGERRRQIPTAEDFKLYQREPGADDE